MGGKHEPSSGASFYLSLSTAALRVVLVVGAVILGVFVLAKAFPTGADRPLDVPPPVEETEEPSPQPQEDGQGGGGGGGGGGQGGQQPADLSGLELQVLNGTDVSDLAGCTADSLEQQETFAGVMVGDSNQPYQRTTIFHVKGSTAEARYLQQTYFADAQLMPATQGAEVPVSVVLGDDYANAPLQGVSECLEAGG